MTRARDRAVVPFVLGAVLLARILLAALRIGLPGLQSDETSFVNAATLRIPHWWIAHQAFGIPLWDYAYLGALKSWLYAPIFSLFGTSAATVRLPMVILVSGSLLLLYVALRDLVNRSVALLAVVLLALDQSVFWYTRNDVGPSAIEFALKCAGLFCIARFAERRAPRWLVLLLIVLGAGVFNKLNFIWYVNALAIISVVVAVRHRASLHACRRSALVWVGGLSLIYASFGLYYLHLGNSSCAGYGCVGSFALRWSQFTHGIVLLLSGTSFYQYVFASIGSRELIAAAMLGLFTIGGLASIVRWRGRSPVMAGLTVGTILIALQCLVTYQANSAWHYIAIYPFVVAVVAYGVYALALALLRTPRGIYTTTALVGITALFYNGLLFAKYDRALTGEPRNSAWSAAIYPLSRYLDHRPGTVFLTEAGVANQLLTLAPSRRYRRMSQETSASTKARRIQETVAHTRGAKLFVTYAPGKLPNPQTNPLEALSSKLSLVKIINGANGDPVFRIYRWRSTAERGRFRAGQAQSAPR
jgi:4-amino-4-deoxy-L-arabinose transferase-like glycosyltransferase